MGRLTDYYLVARKYSDVIIVTFAILILLIGVAHADTLHQTFPISSALTTNNVTDYNISYVNFSAAYTGSGEFFVTYGYRSNTYAFKTENKTGPGTKYFKVWGLPVIPNRTIYYRATAIMANGTQYFASEKTVAVPVMTPVPTTTYGIYMDNFLNTSGDFLGMWGVILSPYEAKMGMFFFGLMVGMSYVALYQKSGSSFIPFLAFMMTGIILLALMRPEFVKLAQACMIMSLAGFLHYLYTGGN